MSIQEGWGRIKSFLRAREGMFPATIVLLVGLASFGLGRLSALQEAKKPIFIATYSASSSTPIALGGEVVASRSGKSYHFPWCPGAETIKESNRIWFKDESEAKKRGYTPAGNCTGLSE
jgi:hypothetical protein